MQQTILDNEFIDSKISRHNLQKMRLLCKVTSVILFCIMGMRLVQIAFLEGSSFVSHLSLLPLICLMLTNAAFIVYSNFYYKRSDYVPIPIPRLTNIYVFSLLLSGVVISVSNPEIYNQLMLFSLLLLLASSYFIIEKKQLLLSLVMNSFVLLVGLYLQQGFTQQFQNQLLYLSILIPIGLYISSAFYKSYTNTLYVQVRLMEEIKEKRKLASDLSVANYRLSRQAAMDSMTGLFNRRALNEYMADLASRANEEPLHVTTLMLDVDYFKQYNDTYGHLEGDKVLVQLADVLQAVSQEKDFFVARYGGEEFTLIMLEADEQQVQKTCQTIVTQIEQLQIEHAGSLIAPYLTVSVGAVSQLALSGSMVMETLEQADQVLYEMKNNGRNGFQVNVQVL